MLFCFVVNELYTAPIIRAKGRELRVIMHNKMGKIKIHKKSNNGKRLEAKSVSKNLLDTNLLQCDRDA